MSRPVTKMKVKLACALPSTRLQEFIHDSTLPSSNVSASQTCTVYHASQLPPSLRQAVLDLVESNMKEMYINSSFGWDLDEKRKELFHSDARLIVVAPSGPSASTSPISAFTVFRFEKEPNRKGIPEPVLYCYEMQAAPESQRKGLGKKLLQALETTAREAKMDKVLLTVFRANTKAIAFYKAYGFEVDETSPSAELDGKDDDYLVLSKTTTD